MTNLKKKFFLISHNEFAHGLKKALEMIIGPQENLYSFGLMPGGHPDEIIQRIEAFITDDTEAVILGDIAGGSVCNSAMRLTTKRNVVLVTGTNLPLAMEIIVGQTTSPEAIQQIITAVREGMKILTLEPACQESTEDFF
ncbi:MULTISPECIES: PTS sugar transporter subunit IIA [Enterococcus]|uniref:PTS sugar transporter subunit IIA n=1 Tax=Enterococcus TaxID=1350 RepID=UPI0012AB8620|nr:PTS mannose transporter subunit IIA [Enterococcus avium]MDT2493034.1 PTS mannose transporter subunit IIA [Enterococcus avium]MDT2564964.1 PTS mannose transporter subunit IIA [Enterococcus avium]NVN75486.1 PTS mannose transporter subunit IIA [Enterococcus avium]